MSTDSTLQHAPQRRHRSWDEQLTSLECAVASGRAALHDPFADVAAALGAEALDAFTPLSRLEPADAARAAALLRDLHDLVRELEAARDSVGRELRLHRSLADGRPKGTSALYLDNRC